MSYYITCPNCGANLDPGEVCECEPKDWPDVKTELVELIKELPDDELDYIIEKMEEHLESRKGA